MADMQMMGLVNGLLALVGVVIALAGVVVCALHVGRSRSVLVLLAGFSVEALVGMAYPLIGFVVSAGSNPESLLTAYAALRLFGLVGQAAVVLGVVGLLGERHAVPASETAA